MFSQTVESSPGCSTWPSPGIDEFAKREPAASTALSDP
jgi:hypothetical protein